MRPSLSLILQRIWHTSEPGIDRAIRMLPAHLKLVLFRSLAKQFRIKSLRVEGTAGRFELDPLDLGVATEYMTTGTYSPELMSLLLRWFARRGPGTMIDIGANVGFVSAPLAKAGVDCICFEPDQKNFSYLQENLSEFLPSGKVQLFNVALMEKNADVVMELSDWNHGDHRIRMTDSKGAFGEQGRTTRSVRAQRLDDVLDVGKLRRPLAIKIDTQGAEVNILKGGTKVISAADLLSLEFCPYLVRRMGEHESVLIDFIEKHFAVGCIENWHAHGRPPQFTSVGELVTTLREFSQSVQSTKHLDLLLSKDDMK
jgi:FkbM family methyltransferase